LSTISPSNVSIPILFCMCSLLLSFFLFFFFNDPPTTVIYTLSLHDALPICCHSQRPLSFAAPTSRGSRASPAARRRVLRFVYGRDRKSTRLNSSHVSISYAVFCLKKKKTI